MVLLMMVLTTVTAWAETETVSYIDADGNQQSVTATILTGSEVSVHGLDCRVHGLDCRVHGLDYRA